MGLSKIKSEANRLKLEQLKALDVWIHELIRKAETARRRDTARREAVEGQNIDTRTYRLENIRCGKEGCRCAVGDLHGPYWYAYWSENGRTRKQYVGKKLPGKKGGEVLM